MTEGITDTNTIDVSKILFFLLIFKAAVRNFFWLKIIRNQYLSKYITNQFSELSSYFSPIHNSKLIIMFSNLNGTGRNLREIRARCCVITSRL